MPDLSAETLAKIQLARSTNVGPVTFQRLMKQYGSACDAIADWPRFSQKNQTLCLRDDVLREVEKLCAAGGWFLLWGDENYPSQLLELPDAPLVLSGFGRADILQQRQIAMVGNRSASAHGLEWSATLAADLTRAGLVITSGLARGIDTAAHHGCLRENGYTIAVVAGGVDHVYPPENAALRAQIIEHGCVVSEQPFGVAPVAHFFPRRNRIIAGLSLGVVVSEATRHSGSLITAECALNYGRDVWAVPGSPSDPRSGGPNWLLKNGAVLIENAADILDGLPQRPAPFVARAKAQPSLFDDAHLTTDDAPNPHNEALAEQPLTRVFALLGHAPAHFDELIRSAALDETALNSLLIELELDGLAVREADGRWRRA